MNFRPGQKLILKEFLKTTTEAAMPNVVGPVAPNPFSIALKIYNGLSKLKKIIDRVVISMQVFMTAVEALGLDQLPPNHQFSKSYNALLGAIAGPLKKIQSSIAKSEEDNAESMFIGEAIDKFKEGYWVDNFDGTGKINGRIIEEFIGEDQNVYEWPLTTSAKRKLVNRGGALVAMGKRDDREFFRIDTALTYNSALNGAIKRAEEDYEEFNKTNVSNTTTSNGSNATDAGGNNKGPGGDVKIGTK